MRIGVNAVPLRVHGGGARFVFTELIEHLLAIDRENEYVIFAHALGLGVVNTIAHLHPHLRHDNATHRRARVVEVGREEDIFEHRDHFDLLFGPLNNLQPRIYDRPSVAILHDIQEQYFPQYFSESDLRDRREIYPEICRSATTLVTISEFCKKSIIEKFAIEPDKIEVLRLAPQSALVAAEDHDEGVWRREPLPERFFFYPANCYLHKNHALLLDALASLKRMGRVPPAAVFTGFELPGGFPLRRQIAERGLQEVCHVFDEVHVSELRYLYRHATAVVLPTLFEGFGILTVEAMACGCPVICSDLPAIREVAGDHALYFKPDRVEQLRDQLEKIQRDDALRARLVAGGQDAARRFSWDRSARRMLDILEEAPARFHSHRTFSSGTIAADAPKIGVLITATRGACGVLDAVREVWRTGYSNVVMRVVFRAGEEDEQVCDFLSRADIPHETLNSGQAGLWQCVRRFAEEEKLDLVGELLAASNKLLPTALHSLAWAFRREPDKAVYLGEAWEEEGGRIAGCARLRLLDTGDWKLEGFLYPEMLFVNLRNLVRLKEVEAHVENADEHWRGVLLEEAHWAKQVCLIRRTLAICDPSQVAALDRFRGVWSGGGAAHSGNGRPRPKQWLRAVKSILRPASRVLPRSLRDKGKRIWRHLADEL